MEIPFWPFPLIVRFCCVIPIAPVVSVILLDAQLVSAVVNALKSTVSPEAAPVTAARRLPVPLSLQLVTAGGTAHAVAVDIATIAAAPAASGLRGAQRRSDDEASEDMGSPLHRICQRMAASRRLRSAAVYSAAIPVSVRVLSAGPRCCA
jgi:hypothetical protein